ncbi:nitrate- and nitrite sensing domain-containing protein, partial [Streptomyces sp. MZ04]|uniref:sensor histidine kinase n=1 Tax=Streptomyces sp. MZ04 TaxID=2559236 RepID=UPI001432A6E9
MTLWSFITVINVKDVSEDNRLKEANVVMLARADDFTAAVQGERRAAAKYLEDPGAPLLEALNGRAKGTDRALSDGFDAAGPETLTPELKERVDQLTTAAGDLPKLRLQVVSMQAPQGDTFKRYTSVIDQGLAVSDALTDAAGNPEETRQNFAISRALEMISRESTIIETAKKNNNRMTVTQSREFLGAAQSHRLILESAQTDLKNADHDVLTKKPYRDLRTLEDEIEDAAAGPPEAITPLIKKWSDTSTEAISALRKDANRANEGVAGNADRIAFEGTNGSGLVIGIGLIGIILSLMISVGIGRGLVSDLIALRNSALMLAGRTIPHAMRRLHNGEKIDVDKEAPLRGYGNDEVGQVEAALTVLHRTTLRVAAERAALRDTAQRATVLKSISGVYVSLARRSQSLLRQQLDMLDAMEQRAEDPTVLDDLFRLDHLTTRMRRHTENLIILSGAAPPRWWSESVVLVDVVRSAVAEVEDYPRVELQGVPPVQVVGSAVTDISHLIAELVENSLSFSSPGEKVRVRGEIVEAGVVLQIEDRGLGMSPGGMAQANRRIQDPHEINLLSADQLGLFVVNRLAHRRGVRVTLHSTPYQGVTAVVFLPHTLFQQQAPQAPAAPRSASPPPLRQTIAPPAVVGARTERAEAPRTEAARPHPEA